MTVTTTAPTRVAPRQRRFTITDCERMAAAGILTEDERVELVAGEIIELSPIGGRHVACVIALTELLGELVGREVSLSVQNPVRCGADSAPQPDVTLLTRRSYGHALPTPADVLLVIEGADSSRDYDRAVKLPLYATAGIAEAWLVDVVSGTGERHTEPRMGRYSQIAIAGRGETLASTVLPAIVLPVDALLT